MTAVAATEFSNAPFSFSEILLADELKQKQDEPEPVTITASDGVALAIKIYEPPPTAITTATSLLFYHGGGAYSGAGYQLLAKGLSEQYGITVFLPDIRGHGMSGGDRGDAPSKQQVWRDVDTALDFVAKTQHEKFGKQASKIYLGGHSSGGGLVVNYATEEPNNRRLLDMLEGYVLVSPELGYLSGTARPDRTDFAKANILAFIVNAFFFGVLGHNKAVQFNYPKELLEADEGLVSFNTVNMANAITPENPKEQLPSMTTADGAKPVALWVGADDELFDAQKVADYVPETEINTGTVLKGKNHLGILVEIHQQIGPWITKQN